MKKFLVTIMVLVMVVGMTACGSSKEKADSDTPKSGATAFFKALKSQDKDALKDTYSGDSKELLGAMSNQSDDSTTDKVQDALSKQMVEKVYSFDYKIGKESVKDKEATVEVTVTTYPFGKVLKNLGQAMAQSGSVPDKDSIDKSLKTLDSEFKNMKKDFEKTFKLKLTKKDGKWLVLAIEKGNIDLADALTGGMLSLTVPY